MNKLKHKDLQIQITKYSLYFIFFAFFCILIFFWSDKKSMINYNDGIKQQYMDFVYGGILIRRFFRNIFIDHIYELPMWDSTMGMGSDPLIVINPLFSPLLCIFSAFVPASYNEYAFDLIVIIRLYLSGLAFLLLAYEKGYKALNAIAGALVYVFSSTTFVVFYQMNFSTTFILFPLILLGADRVWKKQSSLFYFLILTYSIILSFYFTYMILILLVIYCFIRFFCEDGRSVKKFITLFSRFVILTLISLFTGFGAILPGLINLSKLSRLKEHYDIPLIDLEVFKRFFYYGFICIQADGDALIGVSSFALVAAICLFASRKKEPVIKWCLSLCLLSFAFPVVGSVFNGFNYSSFRYIFALILCVAYLVTVSFDSVKVFKDRLWYISLGISALYAVICFLLNDNYSIFSAFSLFISVLLVGIINLFDKKLKTFRERSYIAVIFVSCVIIGYSSVHFYIGHMMLDSGSIYNTVYVDHGTDLRKSVNSNNFRTDTLLPDFSKYIVNSSMVTGINGYDFYQSNQNQFVEDYYSDLAILGHPMGFSHTGFRGRCYTEILTACNYITRSEDDTCIRAPYSYEFVEKDGKYSLYKSNRGVSLAYFYDDVMSHNTFKELNPVERETSLMHSLVINDPKQPESEVISDLVSIPYEICETNNISVNGNRITVLEDNGYIKLKPDTIEPGQVSVYLSGLKSSDVDNWHYRNSVVLLDSDNNPIVTDYSAQCATTDKYYYGNDDVVFSFESITEKVDSIGLIFFNKGEYSLNSIQIYSRPFEQMEKTVNAFYEHADMEDISYDYSGNHLNISAKTDSDRYLYIAIPYSDGWSAKVDGEKAEIIRANIAFMAIPLTSGTHSIEMTYTTPYLYYGLMMSAIGIIIYAGYMIFEKKRIGKDKDLSCVGQSLPE